MSSVSSDSSGFDSGVVACPALFIAAPSSGQGKTTVTAAMARLFQRQGYRVRVFKTGPDYLDPQILEQASGQPVVPLDLWMAGDAFCRQALYDAAKTADLILIEGAMGLFDGEPSSADLAIRFGVPVALLMDVKGMAQTAAAIAVGLANYRQELQVAGLIANGCGTARHAQLIREALPAALPLLATLGRDEAVALPERHLGLVQPSEAKDDMERRLETGADWLQASGLTQLPPPVNFAPVPEGERAQQSALEARTENALQGMTIAVAKDAAFTFIYQANLDLLTHFGARVVFFSPLSDSTVPAADALWLPGGYPELHVEALSGNDTMRASLQAFYESGKVILAECGGFMYCLEALVDLQGQTFPMAGLLPGEAVMRPRGGCQGMQTAPLPEGDVRGHAHHRSVSRNTPEPFAFGRRQRHPAPGESLFHQRGLTASYLHLFFPSNPVAMARLWNPGFEADAAQRADK
ncbi:cobyrinate a,c-diamide synthase [Aestuariicella hydrocarbonica]|uniref:Cobyrinate a,c-diamide synthase n=1 Tax=Pseudomaricurvus hydrocarbonicus TaxID=1470433 RepID=A0A9E5JTG6_9GAMM|nr:cobyrinate a,c-diamide synthase [Aestuariicella hydrocarbonica]NHO64999.1 cobyrinate a,c-diamide synthase [Aestuariicella hydrocarbonica]